MGAIPPTQMKTIRQLCAALAFALAGNGIALAATGDSSSAAALLESYSQLKTDLENNAFGKPIHIVSRQSRDRVEGDIHAVIDQPYDTVRNALGTVKRWCDILIVHPNVTSCRAAPDGESLMIGIGKQATPAQFSFAVTSADAQFLDVQLHADDGPLGTTDYRIRFEATPLDREHTLLRLVYSHAYGLQARHAMRAYLSTYGRGKVGFTVVGRSPDGKPIYVDDFRGALERNAMRYYLCIEAYLTSLSAPPDRRFEKQLQTWYAYTQRYPMQLHEEPEYLALKRNIARATN